MRTSLFAIPLLVLSACSPPPDADVTAPERKASVPPVQGAPTAGWQPDGRHDEFYSRFKGSQTVSGVAHITWEDTALPPGPPGEYVLFNPDQESRVREPLLGELIDIAYGSAALAALGLPSHPPAAADDCGYEVSATVVLGDYYKYDKPESDGFDTAAIVKVTTASKPETVKCNPGLEKLVSMQP